jgi:hypothetical protein
VPPLAAVFAKLFLLQGIAYLCYSNNEDQNDPRSARKGHECLDQASVLLQCLRSAAPDESVQQLLGVMNYGGEENANAHFSKSDVIAALRKSQGDLDAAANAMAVDKMDRRERRRHRELQHQHGLCQNEMDPVDLAQLDILKPLLSRDGGDCFSSSTPNSNSASNARSNSRMVAAANLELAVGLLRLSNNDLTQALEIYQLQNFDNDQVFSSVEALDNRLVQRGLLNRGALAKKRKKRHKLGVHRHRTGHSIHQSAPDEIALVTLISMGVDPQMAQLSLQKNNNNIETSLLWLSSPDAAKIEETGAKREASLSVATNKVGDQQMEADLDNDTDSDSDVDSNDDNSSSDDKPRKEAHKLEREAHELLHRELGSILGEGERNLEKEYLGKSLDEEWLLVQKYRQTKN